MSVLVIDDTGPNTEVVELVDSVLVLDLPAQPSTLTLPDDDNALVVIDGPATATVVVVPGDLLLIDAPAAPAQVQTEDGDDLLVITTSGPPGPPGVPGVGTGYYGVFNFATPTDVWVLHHDQHTYGIDVDTVDNNGDPIEGTVYHTDVDTITVYFYYPQTGEARVFT